MEKIIAEVDKPGLSRTTDVVALEHAGAQDIANQLTRALARQRRGTVASRYRRPSTQTPAGEQTEDLPATVVASPHSNSICLNPA